MFSPWSRLSLLAVLLVAAATTVALHDPQHLLTDARPPRLSGAGAVVAFAAAYGLCTAALVPRPVLNLAAGALFGAWSGTAAAVAGTVLGAGIAFGLGRLLGRDALRPLLVRGRWMEACDRRLSRHGFRSVLVLRVLPGIPFAVSNYGASVTRVRCSAFLAGTALGCVPNTAAYAVAGSRAADPTSPVFLIASAAIAVPAVVAALVAWRGHPGARRPWAAVRSEPAGATGTGVPEPASEKSPRGSVTGPVRAGDRRSPAVSLPVPDRP
nr:TVP38/TMEM64 family protein [Streptomyces taklimakanensis]